MKPNTTLDCPISIEDHKTFHCIPKWHCLKIQWIIMNSIKCVVSICWVVYCQSTQLGYLFSSFPNLIYLILSYFYISKEMSQWTFATIKIYSFCSCCISSVFMWSLSVAFCVIVWAGVGCLYPPVANLNHGSQPRLVNIQFVAGAGSRFVVFTQIRLWYRRLNYSRGPAVMASSRSLLASSLNKIN